MFNSFNMFTRGQSPFTVESGHQLDRTAEPLNLWDGAEPGLKWAWWWNINPIPPKRHLVLQDHFPPGPKMNPVMNDIYRYLWGFYRKIPGRRHSFPALAYPSGTPKAYRCQANATANAVQIEPLGDAVVCVSAGARSRSGNGGRIAKLRCFCPSFSHTYHTFGVLWTCHGTVLIWRRRRVLAHERG